MSRPGPIRRAEAALLPFLIAPGLGFLSVVLSSLMTALPMFRLAEVLGGSEVLRVGVLSLVGQLWAWALLPLMVYGVARIVRLRPWVTSVGAVVTGLGVVLALTVLSRGTEGLIHEHPLRLVLLLLTSGAGVWLIRKALRLAEAASTRAHEAAIRAAEAKKAQYEAFAREAERIASLNGAREDARAAAPEQKTGS